MSEAVGPGSFVQIIAYPVDMSPFVEGRVYLVTGQYHVPGWCGIGSRGLHKCDGTAFTFMGVPNPRGHGFGWCAQAFKPWSGPEQKAREREATDIVTGNVKIGA